MSGFSNRICPTLPRRCPTHPHLFIRFNEKAHEAASLSSALEERREELDGLQEATARALDARDAAVNGAAAAQDRCQALASEVIQLEERLLQVSCPTPPLTQSPPPTHTNTRPRPPHTHSYLHTRANMPTHTRANMLTYTHSPPPPFPLSPFPLLPSPFPMQVRSSELKAAKAQENAEANLLAVKRRLDRALSERDALRKGGGSGEISGGISGEASGGASGAHIAQEGAEAVRANGVAGRGGEGVGEGVGVGVGVRPPPPEVCPWTGPVYREEELERLIARFAERAGVETAEMVCAILNKLGT